MASSRFVSALPAIGALLLACVFGYLVGRITTRVVGLPETPVTIREERGGEVPTVQIGGIENGHVFGTIRGEARFILGNTPVLPDASGSFRVPAGPLLTNMIRVSVPAGMRFVASTRGKKYYPVDSSGAESLSPENRVYFRTAEEAEGAGYGR